VMDSLLVSNLNLFTLRPVGPVVGCRDVYVFLCFVQGLYWCVWVVVGVIGRGARWCVRLVGVVLIFCKTVCLGLLFMS